MSSYRHVGLHVSMFVSILKPLPRNTCTSCYAYISWSKHTHDQKSYMPGDPPEGSAAAARNRMHAEWLEMADQAESRVPGQKSILSACFHLCCQEASSAIGRAENQARSGQDPNPALEVAIEKLKLVTEYSNDVKVSTGTYMSSFRGPPPS